MNSKSKLALIIMLSILSIQFVGANDKHNFKVGLHYSYLNISKLIKHEYSTSVEYLFTKQKLIGLTLNKAYNKEYFLDHFLGIEKSKIDLLKNITIYGQLGNEYISTKMSYINSNKKNTKSHTILISNLAYFQINNRISVEPRLEFSYEISINKQYFKDLALIFITNTKSITTGSNFAYNIRLYNNNIKFNTGIFSKTTNINKILKGINLKYPEENKDYLTIETGINLNIDKNLDFNLKFKYLFDNPSDHKILELSTTYKF